MKNIDALLQEYGSSHQNPTNKLIHWICVPVIFWSIVAMLWSIKLPFDIAGIQVNVAMVAMLLTIIYYAVLSIPLSVGMFAFALLCMLVSYWIEGMATGVLSLWFIALIFFVLAWIVQFVGHKIEGVKPSFFKDLQFLLIGPAWLMSFIFKKIGIAY